MTNPKHNQRVKAYPTNGRGKYCIYNSETDTFTVESTGNTANGITSWIDATRQAVNKPIPPNVGILSEILGNVMSEIRATKSDQFKQQSEYYYSFTGSRYEKLSQHHLRELGINNPVAHSIEHGLNYNINSLDKMIAVYLSEDERVELYQMIADKIKMKIIG